jgi:hypothetical protein
MSSTDNLYELLRALDPLTTDLDAQNASRSEEIWANVVTQHRDARTPVRRRRWLVGSGSLAVVASAAALVIGLLPGAAPLSAAAATLTSAAQADASAAALPTLAAGQYYYQRSGVSMVCKFASPSMSSNVTYIAEGTMQSWTAGDGSGKVVFTPSPVGADGSHFATPQDQAAWVAAGSPFIPCALMNPSNAFIGNPANSNPGKYGGYATSVSGYTGFGFMLSSFTQSSQLAAGTSVNNLPSDVGRLSSMLANGEINTDGSVSSTPQICAAGTGPTSATPGCTTTQQLGVIEQLMQVPDASAKLGSALYQVLAQIPGTTQAGTVTDAMGRTGTAIIVPLDQNEQFEVVLDPTTGALLSCSALIAGQPAPAAQMTYGAISVVQGVGAIPSGQ